MKCPKSEEFLEIITQCSYQKCKNVRRRRILAKFWTSEVVRKPVDRLLLQPFAR